MKKLCCCIGLLGALEAGAVDDASLWLPAAYSEYWDALRLAAVMVENTEPCVRVVEGTVVIADDSRVRPRFRIHCQGKKRRDYSVLVDGDTLEVIATDKP